MELGEKIRAERESRGWSQERLAQESGTTQSTIDRLERGTTKFSRKLYRVLEVLGLQEAGRDFLSVSPATGQQYEIALPNTGRDMPLYPAVEGGSGALLIEKNPIGRVARPAHLDGIEDAYAVYIAGESMFPEYEPGDIAEVNPRLPPIPGATCVFYTNDPHDDRAMIKRLEKMTRTEWHLRQWNPPEGEEAEFLVSRIEWPVCHRVVGRVPRK